MCKALQLTRFKILTGDDNELIGVERQAAVVPRARLPQAYIEHHHADVISVQSLGDAPVHGGERGDEEHVGDEQQNARRPDAYRRCETRQQRQFSVQKRRDLVQESAVVLTVVIVVCVCCDRCLTCRIHDAGELSLTCL